MARSKQSDVEYSKPTSQVDLETRLQADAEETSPPPRRKGEDYDAPAPYELQGAVNPSGEPTDEGYIGTDVIYQNYAEETNKPLQADEGADKLAEEAFAAAFRDGEDRNPPAEQSEPEPVTTGGDADRVEGDPNHPGPEGEEKDKKDDGSTPSSGLPV
jgi:hypothetical protein